MSLHFVPLLGLGTEVSGLTSCGLRAHDDLALILGDTELWEHGMLGFTRCSKCDRIMRRPIVPASDGTLHERLRLARLRVGHTLSTVRDPTDHDWRSPYRRMIGFADLQRIEEGRQPVTTDQLIIFARAYKVSLLWLLLGERTQAADAATGAA